MPKNDLCPKKVLIFDLNGPMAHFRKYFTNSSSLSYLFPPRTVVVGLIAGLLGLPSERHTNKKEDIYYEKFSKELCCVTLSLRTKIRRIMQKVNYIKTKTDTQSKYSFEALVTGARGAPTQIPIEILLPEDNDEISYRIYFYHKDKELYNELKSRLDDQRFAYPPYMGITEFLATINHIYEATVAKYPERKAELNSVCKSKDVALDFSCIDRELQYSVEKMPTGFLNDRTPLKPESYLTEIKGNLMKVTLKDEASCYSVNYSEWGRKLFENIMFM